MCNRRVHMAEYRERINHLGKSDFCPILILSATSDSNSSHHIQPNLVAAKIGSISMDRSLSSISGSDLLGPRSCQRCSLSSSAMDISPGTIWRSSTRLLTGRREGICIRVAGTGETTDQAEIRTLPLKEGHDILGVCSWTSEGRLYIRAKKWCEWCLFLEEQPM